MTCICLRSALGWSLSLALAAQTPAPAPLPSAAALMAELEANQVIQKRMAENYTYQEQSVTRMLDGKGALIKEERAEYEYVRIHGHPLKRLVKKDGVALTEADAAKEDERLQKEALKASTDDSSANLKQVTLTKLFQFLDVTGVSRDTLGARPVLVLAFQPRAKVKTKDRNEELVSKLAGRIFLDEASRDLVQIEARLTDSVGVWGGLLGSIAAGANLVVHYGRVSPEWSAVTQVEFECKARALFKHMQVKLDARYSDFRKFSVDPVQLTALPAQP